MSIAAVTPLLACIVLRCTELLLNWILLYLMGSVWTDIQCIRYRSFGLGLGAFNSFDLFSVRWVLIEWRDEIE